jgi:hypothetical protein
LLALGATALASSTASVELGWHALSAGGGSRVAESLYLRDSLGQPLIGQSQGDSVALSGGFWAIAPLLPAITPPPVTPTRAPTRMPSTVPPPAGGLLSNISTRGWVGQGDDVLIGGLIVAGAEAEVILRAIGPDLTERGVPGALQDPELTIYDGQGSPIAHCDDWQTCPGAETLGGLAPADPREAALRLSLAPGGYTAIVRGKAGDTGVALVEGFHAGGQGLLSNLSTRGKVGTDDRVMIGGFIVAQAATTVILRAIGRELGDRSVPGYLEDPTLSLHDGTGQRIGFVDDWRDALDPTCDLGALTPAYPRDSALCVSLEPGAYTAIVRGAAASTGVALVEVFRK